jgi:saccharopine dehydrogenase-like NADP-dependent oxidoreductase
MAKIIVLGAGNMGAYIAFNLSAENDVTIADYSQAALDKVIGVSIKKIKTDLSDLKNIKHEIAGFDLVVSALPESFGYIALKSVIMSGKNVVDISFWEQDKKRLFELEALAKKHGVTVFIDCGIAPGFSNGLVAFFDSLLSGKTKNASIYVGGIPKDKEKGFFAPWSISGLVEEYQRKALCVHNNRRKRVEALSVIKKISFPGVGELEGAITDGLRTLPLNLKHVRNMSEFTLRYPGHFYQMKMLKNLGYFNDGLIKVYRDKITSYELSQLLLKKITKKNRKMNEEVLTDLGFYEKTYNYDCIGKKISPRKVAISVLSKRWKMNAEDRDVLVMRVEADDGKTRYSSDIYAEHDGVSSAMALTTGGMAALAARAIFIKKFELKGVFPLEKAIKEKPELMQYFSRGLQKLGVLLLEKPKTLL